MLISHVYGEGDASLRFTVASLSLFVMVLTACVQSVFLNDITRAYEKNPQLESLLFDDFFNKGASLLYVTP
jgi:6-phosphogluconate dehydrogenase